MTSALDDTQTATQTLTDSRRLVIKIGSSLLADDEGNLHSAWIDALAEECSRHERWETARGEPVRFLMPWHRRGLRREVSKFNTRWQEYLEPAVAAEIERRLASTMAALGYEPVAGSEASATSR